VTCGVTPKNYFLTSEVTVAKKIAVPVVPKVQWFDRLTMSGQIFRSW